MHRKFSTKATCLYYNFQLLLLYINIILNNYDQQQPRKRGRPRKTGEPKIKPKTEDGEDMLLKETILAFSEPIPEHILNPKPKKKSVNKKKYIYEKT